MATAFIYNPFTVDGPGKPYRTLTAAQLWRKYELRNERPNTYDDDAVVGDFPQLNNR